MLLLTPPHKLFYAEDGGIVGFLFDAGGKRLDIVFEGDDEDELRSRIAEFWRVEYPKARRRLGKPLENTPARCAGCDQDYADPPSPLCPGCQAYKEHQT